MAPIRSRGEEDEDADSDGINRYVRRLLRERGKAERSRQAYVALTRAKRTLHLYVHPRESGDGGEISHSAAPGSLLENLWSAVRDEVAGSEVVGEETTHDGATVLPVSSQLRRRLVRQPRSATPPPDVIARGEILQAGIDEEDLVFDWARQAARRVGTVVHEELERLARHGALFAESPRLLPRLESRLRTLGLDADGARSGAERAVTALRATLADDRGRWLFDPRHRDAHSELELTGLRGGRVVNAVIDRIFVDDTGTRWVVDFKTSPHEGGDLEEFFAAQAVRYTPQLARYAELARELGPEPVRAGLYFPLLGAWREVPLTS
jgi:ATP-dependent exoDNAse (exonuclease V) beta subunit